MAAINKNSNPLGQFKLLKALVLPPKRKERERGKERRGGERKEGGKGRGIPGVFLGSGLSLIRRL